MDSLEKIQCFFKEKERQEKHEALQLLEACESMRRYKGRLLGSCAKLPHTETHPNGVRTPYGSKGQRHCTRHAKPI